MPTHDAVLRGARTLDPETALDAVCDVAVTDGRISAVAVGGDPALEGQVDLSVADHVLAPGFIDLHSHCRDLPSRWLQVCDGVTTALELEAGELDVARVYQECAEEGQPNHYGFSASWALARMAACGLDVTTGGDDAFFEHIDAPAWHRTMSLDQRRRMLDALHSDLAEGALGIGILLGYCVESEAAEYFDVAALAGRLGVPTFTHVRELDRPDGGLMGAAEVVTAALATGAHMHLCHINSTSLREVDRAHSLLDRARQQGLRVTSEAYPYGAGCTGIGAGFLDPAFLSHLGLTSIDIRVLSTGERPASDARLAELRAADPGALVVIDLLREGDPDDLGFLTRALLADDTAVASDAMPLVSASGSPQDLRWPELNGAMTHPRTAGTFSRVMRWYVRELGVLSLTEAVRRCTLVPADILRDVAPAMARKGRVQVGADADLVVFDPDTITDRATYEDPTRTSEGIRHVLVGGAFVVRDGVLDTAVRPGRPVRGAVT